MQGLWNLIGKMGTAAQSFPYEIGEKMESCESKCPWSIHHGKKKATGDPVTVFVLDVKNSSDNKVKLAKSALKRLKTLRHPNIITYVDSLESDTLIYLVTEPVVPLDVHFKDDNAKSDMAVSWGIHQIAAGISFLVNDCNLQHGNVCVSAVFVDNAGEWKLGGVEYVQPLEPPPGAEDINVLAMLLPALKVYDPPEGRKYSKTNKRLQKWSADTWGLGCLIWEIFNGSLSRSAALKSVGQIPQSLIPHYGELVSANPKLRPNPTKFIESCRAKGHYLKNHFVDANLFLRELQIKDPKEQKTFFSTLSSSVDSFPESFCRHRILPQLINAFEYGSAGSAVLGPLFKVGKLLEADEYQTKIVPCVVKLFSSTDRATRIHLLQQLDQFVEYLKPQIVDEQIFPHVVLGFGDTVPAMREQTVKAMLLLASKLSEKTINNQLLKHFAKLQMDPEAGIRTNTTVCLGKISCHLTQATRQKVLVSAFVRPLRDPFPPARSAGIMAFCSSHTYYSLKDCASKILPALCTMTLDPEKKVRDQSFKAIKLFLEKLEKASDDPESDLNKSATEQAAAGDAGSSSWTGWAVTSLTSKLYRGGLDPATADNAAVTSEDRKPQQAPEEVRSNAKQSPKQKPKDSTPARDKTRPDKETDVGFDEDWGEGWDGAEEDSSEKEVTVNDLRNDLMSVKQECRTWQNNATQRNADDEEAEDSGSDYDDWNNDDWSAVNNFCQKNKKTESIKDEIPSFVQTEGKSASHFFTGPDTHLTVEEDLDPFTTLTDTNLKTSQPPKPQPSSGQSPKPSGKGTTEKSARFEGDWGLDDWGSFDETPPNKPAASTIAKETSGTILQGSKAATSTIAKESPGTLLQGSSWDSEEWGSLEQPSSKSEGQNWDNWNDDWGSGNAETSGMSNAELAKKKREERKQQRLQAMKDKKASGGTTNKLGAVKMQ